jgi:hypothetical protein
LLRGAFAKQAHLTNSTTVAWKTPFFRPRVVAFHCKLLLCLTDHDKAQRQVGNFQSAKANAAWFYHLREVSGARVLKAIRWLQVLQISIQNTSITPFEEVCLFFFFLTLTARGKTTKN